MAGWQPVIVIQWFLFCFWVHRGTLANQVRQLKADWTLSWLRAGSIALGAAVWGPYLLLPGGNRLSTRSTVGAGALLGSLLVQGASQKMESTANESLPWEVVGKKGSWLLAYHWDEDWGRSSWATKFHLWTALVDCTGSQVEWIVFLSRLHFFSKRSNKNLFWFCKSKNVWK